LGQDSDAFCIPSEALPNLPRSAYVRTYLHPGSSIDEVNRSRISVAWTELRNKAHGHVVPVVLVVVIVARSLPPVGDANALLHLLVHRIVVLVVIVDQTELLSLAPQTRIRNRFVKP